MAKDRTLKELNADYDDFKECTNDSWDELWKQESRIRAVEEQIKALATAVSLMNVSVSAGHQTRGIDAMPLNQPAQGFDAQWEAKVGKPIKPKGIVQEEEEEVDETNPDGVFSGLEKSVRTVSDNWVSARTKEPVKE